MAKDKMTITGELREIFKDVRIDFDDPHVVMSKGTFVELQMYLMTEFEHLINELEALQAELEAVKVDRNKALHVLDAAGVWTGADDLVSDRIEAVLLHGYTVPPPDEVMRIWKMGR